MREPVTGGQAGDDLLVTVRRADRVSPELVVYGCFLAGMLIVYAAGVIYGQRRLAAQYRRIDAAIARSRIVRAHRHAYTDIDMPPVPDGYPPLGVVPESERDDGDISEH